MKLRRNIDLLVVNKPIGKYDDESMIQRIAETVPMIMDICSHPKKSLRVDEAILDVNLVKRINSNTMKQLASHSEHWKTKRLDGLIPSRLNADTFEEDINIYENLFFRMAVSDILEYVTNQIRGLEKTIKSLEKGLNWEKYSKVLNDKRRQQILMKLIPNYAKDKENEKGNRYRELLNKWAKLGMQLSNVKASIFFRSISKRSVSRNIHTTNILKNDSRYNALFRLWNDIQMNNAKEKLEFKGLAEKLSKNKSSYYSQYVCTLFAYSLDLMKFNFDEVSRFMKRSDGFFDISLKFEDSSLAYYVNTVRNNYGQLELKLTIREKKDVFFILPEQCRLWCDEIQKKLGNGMYLDKEYRIHFEGKITEDEKNSLLKALKNSFLLSKGVGKEMRKKQEMADIAWRKSLTDFFMAGKIIWPREKVITIIPQFTLPSKESSEFEEFTEELLSTGCINVVYTYPVGVEDYDNINDERLVWRLINYGEKYSPEDAAKEWGNYKKGILPIGQYDLYSIQRLINLILLHSQKLKVEWSDNEQLICPACESSNCQEIDATTWKCNEHECGLVFGKTKCQKGCGLYFEWIRPQKEVNKMDLDYSTPIRLLLTKESILGSLAITDFDFEESNKKMTYIPICPKCGRRR